MFQGKSVDSAIEKALNELQLEKKDVSIKVIDHGSQKLFGLSRANAKILVSKRDLQEKESQSGATDWEAWLKKEIQDNPDYDARRVPSKQVRQTNLEGKAWIKDGHLYFKDTDTKKPVLNVSSDIKIVKNGTPVSERTFLTEGDKVDFNLETTATETKWSMKINEEKQLVRLAVEPGGYSVPHLEDHPPAEVITARADVRFQPDNQLTEKDIYDQLDVMRITTGINHEAIRTACKCSEPASFIVAHGKLPKHGEHGDVQFSIDINERTMAYTENHDGTVNFRESVYIPSIEEGELLGTVKDPTPGEDGISVFGDLLKAKSGEPVILKMGTGIGFLENENKLIALEKGRPKIDKKGRLVRLSISPKLLHTDDLKLEDGNIHFIGDVEITGNVTEQMTVDTEGSAWIHKSTLQSSVLTRNSITVAQNAISSSLIAGKNSLVFDEMGQKLQPFLDVFEPFAKVLKQLVESERFRETYKSSQGLGPVIKVLTETKFKQLTPVARELLDTINKRQDLLNKVWQSFAVKIYKGVLVYHHNEFKTFEDIETFHTQALTLHDICQSPAQNRSVIQVDYAHNSGIHCNGDVHILGKGSVHSTIHADGKVTIRGRAMGGAIYGKEGVQIGQAGSLSGVKTLIEVPYDQLISINEVMADTVIKVGNRRHIFKQDQSKIRARLNEDDQLILH